MRILIIALLLLISAPSYAQPAEYRMSREEYIERYKDEAIKEMMMNKIPASIILAQALLETADGNSPLAKYANNHFGIKCHGWSEFSYAVDDDAANECFRKYGSVLESYADHSRFLKTRRWYQPLFQLKLTDYAGWAKGLKAAGYATLPEYAELLIQIIEEHKLYQFDHFETAEPKQLEADLDRFIRKQKRKEIIINSKLDYIITRAGDSYTRIALRHNITLKKIHEYNDLPKDAKLSAGMVIYLQPKENVKQDIDFHLVQNETLYEISQIHGIRIASLISMNPWLKERNPVEGDIVRLNNFQPQPVEPGLVALVPGR